MCVICVLTNTFDPTRHPAGTHPLQQLDNSSLTTGEIASASAVTVGSSYNGTISTGGERDFFTVTLEAGKGYQIDTLGSASSGGGTLVDPDLHIFDSAGTYIAYDDGSGAGFDARLNFTAATSGTYYVLVDGYYSSSTGSYRLDIAESVTVAPSGSTGTYEQLASYLKDQQGTTTELTLNLPPNSNVVTVNISNLSADGQQLALWAMEAWEMVVNIDFQLVTSGALVDIDDQNAAATANNPSGQQAWAFLGASSTQSGVHMMVSQSWLDQYGSGLNSYSFQTYVHELGHILGLNHLGAYDGIATWGSDNFFANDSWQVSVMSYFNQTESPNSIASYNQLTGAQIADIIAVQDFYGAPGNGTVTAGNTIWGGAESNLGNYMDTVFAAMANGTYTMAFTIYDQGGTDTLDLAYLSASQASNINLNGGTFSSIGADVEIMGIAVGTIVENANLGAGNDTVVGNEANNVINSGAGNDTINGGAGNDVINGGAGTDVINGGAGTDWAAYDTAAVNIRAATSGVFTVVYDTSGAGGVDVLVDVENVSFSGGLAASVSAFTQFEALRYIASYVDLSGALGANTVEGLAHYLISGVTEGRTVTFRALDYLASHLDLIGVFGLETEAASGHYITYGAAEGRGISFSGLQYIASYADLRGVFGSNAEAGATHFIQSGAAEGRGVSFSALNYLASHADLRAVFGADTEAGARHYIDHGAGEGRGTTFNGLEYIASHSDLRGVFGSDAEGATLHYITSGADEGRGMTFSGLNYLASYADLISTFGVDGNAATLHYIIGGATEGRALNQRAGLDVITAAQLGGGGDDVINGTAAGDLLVGLNGNDTLVGGGGDDVLVGGNGSDTFIFGPGFAKDVIIGFDALDPGEKIDLTNVVGITDFNDLANNGHLAVVGGHVTIIDEADTIALWGVNQGDLDASDFIF
ncbi:pre-peptidase C-terminal domain-containing protein [Parasedimentitalea maritima]|uniref:Matrixin family metalloprotease n=1 Tax=Parasedimentitalea maritima TaxID=2578117 RepID=A0A6A4R9N7_9RHOB|nr:M10 family metallopeptidase C-terminal domain-containing protein [Zongyanglinia marina]KAE9629295.1 matrixin family metalloprotease [Zongyanglinia marina]